MPIMQNNEPHPSGVMFSNAYQAVYADLISQLEHIGHQDIAAQLENVLIASQALDGYAENFSFMAYPIPRLDLEQRQSIKFEEKESVKLNFLGGCIQIDLDGFGQVNWFHISDIPEMYSVLQKFKNYIGT